MVDTPARTASLRQTRPEEPSLNRRATPLAILAVAAPLPALAAPAPATPAAPPAVSGVTVTVNQGLRTSIDRRSYNVAAELQAGTGSITDALRNIPSVQVDVEGNLSLRGDANVIVMIDGKPSGMFQGEGRAQALEQLPADQIERVEVITNPTAALSPEGSAGVINLVTKKTFRGGYSGSVRANVGTDNRGNAGVNAAYADRKLTVSGNTSVRHDENSFSLLDQRTRRDPVTGLGADSLQEGSARSGSTVASFRAAVDYDPDTRTRYGAELRRIQSDSKTRNLTHQEQEDTAGALVRALDRVNDVRQERSNSEASLSYRRKFSGEGHELTASLDREWTSEDRTRLATNVNRVPLLPDAVEAFEDTTRLRQDELRIDYVRPAGGEATLKLGYRRNVDENTYDNRGRRGPAFADLAEDPGLTYLFDYRQAVDAGYITYERPLGDLTVLGGLRAEQVHVDVALRGAATHDENAYSRVYPSLHLSYRLAEGQQLTASYSQRVQRPRADDLNPFRIYSDPFNFRQGNPRLKPQNTRAYELGYQYRKERTYYLATLYYRQSSGGISDVVRDLGGGVFLTSRENLRQSRSGGLELVANGRFGPKLTYSATTNLLWNELDASPLGLGDRRSAFAYSGHANLNWQVTPKDFLQISGYAAGRRLNVQGYTTGFATVSLGYRHKFSDKLTGVATAQDIFDSSNQRQVFDTPQLTGTVRRQFSRRGLYVGLTWAFGAQRQQQRDQGMEFEQVPEAE